MKYKWFLFGTSIGVQHHKLKEFENENDPYISLIHYLVTNGKGNGKPISWNDIAIALKSEHVSEPGLGDSILEKFCLNQSEKGELCTDQYSHKFQHCANKCSRIA